jgi:menaquinol-cytochrome c reductase iron-sulfur subunit
MATSRRGFLTKVVGGTVGVLLGIPIVGVLVTPLLRPTIEPTWVEAGPVDDLPVLEPRAFRVPLRVGPAPDPEIDREVFAVRRVDGSILALLGECTHLGCPVRWLADRRLFYCPCHRGFFNVVGHDVNGPPPRPLYVLQHRVENGILYVTNERVTEEG